VKAEKLLRTSKLIRLEGGIMKRTIIRSTVMVLAVLAVSISIHAQSAQEYSADIPFNFEVRGERHSAGKYRLGSVSVSSPAAIVLRELQSGDASILGMSADPGSNNWDNAGTLTFVKVNGKYRLREISTATFRLKMKATKTDIREVATIGSAEVVKINLN